MHSDHATPTYARDSAVPFALIGSDGRAVWAGFPSAMPSTVTRGVRLPTSVLFAELMAVQWF